jgi:hypothetical protein
VWCQIVNIAFSEVGGKKEQQLLVATKYGVEVSEPATGSAAAAQPTQQAHLSTWATLLPTMCCNASTVRLGYAARLPSMSFVNIVAVCRVLTSAVLLVGG